MIDLEELRRLAGKANSSKWRAEGGSIYSEDGKMHIYDEGEHTKHDAAYIAAVNPSVILELIERVRKLETALAYAIKEADGWFDDSRGGQIDEPEMDAARALLVK